jgi:ketosteroid isomerase-like protein
MRLHSASLSRLPSTSEGRSCKPSTSSTASGSRYWRCGGVSTRYSCIVPEQPERPTTLAIVRAHLEHIERDDLAQAAADYAEDGVLEAGLAGVVSLEGTFRGRAAIGQWLENWFSSFAPGSYHFEVEQAVENDDRIYLVVSGRARGKTSGVEATNLLHHVFTVRDGLIVRHAFSGEPEEIRRAAGVPSR